MHKPTKLNSLDSLPVNSSGLDELNQEFKQELDYQNYLEKFLAKKHDELDKIFQERPDLISTIKTKALFLLNLLASGQQIKSFHISVTGNKPALADNCAFELIKLAEELNYGFDFYSLNTVMPTIIIHYSDYILKGNHRELFNKAQAIINDDKLFDQLIDENLIAQKYRLRALYLRRCHCEDGTRHPERSEGSTLQDIEHNLNLYRQHFKPDLSKPIYLNKIKPQKNFSANELLDKLPELYQEVAAIQEEVLIRSGIYQDTCFYFNCSDCCKKDFPTVSLVEFLHIKSQLSNDELNKLKAKAKLIQEAHEKQYGTRLEIVDQSSPGKQKENPHNFQFTCPFLDDKDTCTVHSARPLACRSFGLSTIDDKSVQACKFYLTQYQYNASHRNERDVYDSQPHTEMIGRANELLAKEHGLGHMKQPVATLVAWLLDCHS